MAYDYLQKIEAVFAPKRMDDLVRTAMDLIGQTHKWQAIGIIEEGPYKGQQGFMPIGPNTSYPFAWVPECDLQVTEPDHA